MRVDDALVGAVLLVFAVAEMAHTRTFPTLHGQSYGPDLFPLLIGTGLCACGATLIVRGPSARRAASEAPPWFEFPASLREPAVRTNLILLSLCLLLCILVSDVVGFVPMSFATLTLLFVRPGSPPVMSLSLAMATTLILYLLSSRALPVPLPSGILQGLLG